MSATEDSLAESMAGDQPNAAKGSADADANFKAATRGFPATVGISARPGGRSIRGSKGSSAAIFIVATALVGGVLAWIWASGQGETYSATAVVQLEPADTIDESGDVVDVVGSLDRGTIVVTAAGLANSGVVKTAAQGQLGMSSLQAEDYEVESLQVLTSHLIDITVTGPDEAQAVAYADAIADELQLSFAESYPVYQMTTVTPASIPDSSGRPGVAIIVIAAMIASAIGAFMLWLALFGGSDERTDLPLFRRS